MPTASTLPLHLALKNAEAALRRERMRARVGDWTYSLTRHLELSRQIEKLRASIAEANTPVGYQYDLVDACERVDA